MLDTRPDLDTRQQLATDRPGTWATHVTKIVFIGNPRASNYRRARSWIDQLSKKLHVTPVTIDVARANAREVTAPLHGLQKDDLLLLAVGGGDGTLHTVINAVLADSKIAHSRICVLPLWGGNANDFAYMLNGLSSKSSTDHLLQQAALVRVPLIHLQLSSATSQKTMYACCYASFGASAHAARHLDQKRAAHRKFTKKRLLPFLIVSELWTVSRALITAPLHAVTAGQNRYNMYEHMLVNGPRIAKVDKVPVSLTEPQFFYATLHRKSLGLFFKTVLKIIGRRPDGNWSKRTQLSFTIDSPSPMQIDGEILELASSTKINASVYRSALRFVSTRG